MEKLINYEKLRRFAYSNDKSVVGEIKGIVVNFLGLNNTAMYAEDTEEGRYFAKNGIIYVVPYTNPWCWMNRQSVAYVDEIIEAVIKKYSLQDVKLVACGGSMGGLSAIVYCRYSKYTPKACVLNCPVCDLVYHYGEREDLPRTLYTAFYSERGKIENVLKKFSPYHLVKTLPNIPYTIFHCTKDNAVNIDKHSIKFVKKMIKNEKQATLIKVYGRDHCDLTEEAKESYKMTVLNSLS